MFLVTEGVPSDEDLEWLSYQVTDRMTLARVLRLKGRNMEIESRCRNIFEHTFRMLKRWKERNGSDATYAVLRDALGHPFVGRKDLADKLGSNLPQFITSNILLIVQFNNNTITYKYGTKLLRHHAFWPLYLLCTLLTVPRNWKSVASLVGNQIKRRKII